MGFDHRAESSTKYDRLLATWVSTSFTAYAWNDAFSPPGMYVSSIYTYSLIRILLPVMYRLVYRSKYRTMLNWVST